MRSFSLTALVSSLLLQACSEPSQAPLPTTISIDLADSVTGLDGDSILVVATVFSGSKRVIDPPIEWAALDPSIARIRRTSLSTAVWVRGVSVGSTTVRARLKDGGFFEGSSDDIDVAFMFNPCKAREIVLSFFEDTFVGRTCKGDQYSFAMYTFRLSSPRSVLISSMGTPVAPPMLLRYDTLPVGESATDFFDSTESMNAYLPAGRYQLLLGAFDSTITSYSVNFSTVGAYGSSCEQSYVIVAPITVTGRLSDESCGFDLDDFYWRWASNFIVAYGEDVETTVSLTVDQPGDTIDFSLSSGESSDSARVYRGRPATRSIRSTGSSFVSIRLEQFQPLIAGNTFRDVPFRLAVRQR